MASRPRAGTRGRLSTQDPDARCPMSGLSVVPRGESVNGLAKQPARKPHNPGKPRGNHKGMRHARRLAGAVGAVGVGVLGLSVAHCTESIGLLTGSHWALAGL